MYTRAVIQVETNVSTDGCVGEGQFALIVTPARGKTARAYVSLQHDYNSDRFKPTNEVTENFFKML